MISSPIPAKNVFKTKKREKRKQESSDRLEDAECYKSRRVEKRSGAIMRMQQTAGTILAAPLVRFRVGILLSLTIWNEYLTKYIC